MVNLLYTEVEDEEFCHEWTRTKTNFHLTGMDTMDMIRKHPAYPVNPCSNKLQIFKCSGA